MLKANNIEIRFNTRVLFENVNLEFKDDNCYGIIGANGAGKSTFLKILSGELEPTKGDVILGKGERLSVLKQNHNEFDEYTVLDTVIMGDYRLYKVMKEKNDLYMKEDFSMEDGMKVAELEEEFASLNGWQAESDIAVLLSGLGLKNDVLYKEMKELKDSEKVKVLLARAIFGNPDVLLLDEPTNGLDSKSIMWLEEYLINFKNTVLVVSHDRHFLNKVCTHMVDIDYGKITLFVGNYDFWYESSQLIQRQMKDSNKKKEDKIKELEDFIRRFSANASKSKQATSRKRSLEKIVLDEIKPSSRKYPYINFEIDKVLGKEGITLENVSYVVDGKTIIKDLNLNLTKSDKIVLIGTNEIAKTALLNIISGQIEPTSGTIKYGSTVKLSYYEKNHSKYFKDDSNLIEWLRNYSDNKDESFVRGFLGRMLFSGEESLKKVSVLSGGEKVRCMFSKVMLERGNVLLLDEPTNHLDIESITSLNEGLKRYDSALIISTFDQEIIESVGNRLIEIKSDGSYNDKQISYEEYIEKFGLDDIN
ncbi:MAG TPA: ATP-binding cassette domain-containing protein [Bacilli bacterium]|nr:ATP-binding cassette domain-containing protein [Bacilli bacterium]